MKVSSLPVLIIRDHQGNILHREYKDLELDPEQSKAICALLAKLIDIDRAKNFKQVGAKT